MRRTVSALAFLFLLAPLLPGPAAAEGDGAPGGPGAAPAAPTTRAGAPITIGARVGGYGFRSPGTVDGHGHVAWDRCRMNGLGVFARRPLGRLFTEAGADLYYTESFPMDAAAGDDSVNRVSGLLTAAIGAEVVRTRYLRAYAQVGAGLELTKVAMTMPNGEIHGDRRALPLGFVGVGGELRLGPRTTFGASLRTHVMGYFDPGGWGHQHGATGATDPDAEPTLDVSPELAAQGQFYIGYRL